MALSIGDIIETRLEGYIKDVGIPWNLVCHWKLEAYPSEGSDWALLTSFAQIVYDQYATTFMPYLSDDCKLVMCRAKRIAPTPSVFAMYTDATSGGISTPCDEYDDAMVVTKRTNRAGRRGMGRSYIAGVPDANVEDGIIQGNLNDYAGAAQAFFPLFVGSGDWEFIPVVFSRTSFDAGAAEILWSAEIERVEIDAIMRKQSRREIPGRLPVTYEEPA